MKSKAHLKKCLELGVSPMNLDNTDVAGKSFMANRISVILLVFYCLNGDKHKQLVITADF